MRKPLPRLPVATINRKVNGKLTTTQLVCFVTGMLFAATLWVGGLVAWFTLVTQ